MMLWVGTRDGGTHDALPAPSMPTGLEHLLSEGVLSEVVARLKSGKEAEVYVVRYGAKVVAAKVYKDRAHRSFKNNADYKEGRSVRNTRSQRAMARGSKFGRAAAEDAWKTAEVDALYKLHAAGVRVPTPVMYLDGVLLMELVLDAEGEAAPRLIDVGLTPQQANAAYMDMLGQLVRILSCELIHGDLSPYNVLWGASGPTIIDFPQIISASHNSRSEVFFMRDARNILGHFAEIDRSLLARSGDASQIWRAYVRRELTPDFMPSGRAPAFVPRPRPSRPGLLAPPPRGAAPTPRNTPPPQHHGSPPRPNGPPSPRNGPAPARHGPPPRHSGPSQPHGSAQPRHNAPGQARNGPPQRTRPQGPEVFVRIARGGPPAATATPRDERLVSAQQESRPAPGSSGDPATTAPASASARRRRRRRR
jgi:RIO kinase 1